VKQPLKEPILPALRNDITLWEVMATWNSRRYIWFPHPWKHQTSL